MGNTIKKNKTLIIRISSVLNIAVQDAGDLDCQELTPLMDVIDTHDGEIIGDYRQTDKSREELRAAFFESAAMSTGRLAIIIPRKNVGSFIDALEQGERAKGLIKSIYDPCLKK